MQTVVNITFSIMKKTTVSLKSFSKIVSLSQNHLAERLFLNFMKYDSLKTCPIALVILMNVWHVLSCNSRNIPKLVFKWSTMSQVVFSYHKF